MSKNVEASELFTHWEKQKNFEIFEIFGPDANTIDWYTKLGVLKAHSLSYKTKKIQPSVTLFHLRRQFQSRRKQRHNLWINPIYLYINPIRFV